MTMKHIRSGLRGVLTLLATALLCWSCEDMNLQKDYDYERTPLDPHIDMTAWEFMNSRTDLFSLMIEAAEYGGMEGSYKQTEQKLTYLLIDDAGMRLFLNRQGALLMTQVDVEKVRKLLQYHTIVGEYHAYDKKLPVEPIYVKTMLDGEDGLMTIKVNKTAASSVGSPIANGNILVNSNNFASASISSISSNIMPVNGVIHVFSGFAYYRKTTSYTPAY